MKNQGHYSRNNLDHCLTVSTDDCHSVIEFGCMFGRQLSILSCPVKVGVEIHKPYLERAEYAFTQICADERTEASTTPTKSYDAVLLCDFLEHLTLMDAVFMVLQAKRIARKRIVVFVPHGLHPQTKDVFELGADEHQTHRSTWWPSMLVDLGFDVAVWDNFHNKPGSDHRAMFAIWEPR